MRINSSIDLKEEHGNNAVRANLADGYCRGLWNPNHGAVLLVACDSISTVIPDTDLELSEDLDQCSNCEALIMEDCELDNCRWCGEEDYEESVSTTEYQPVH